jgi:hypothetical protein
MHSSEVTSAKSLGNSKEVAERHYIKTQAVLPDARVAAASARSGLVKNGA